MSMRVRALFALFALTAVSVLLAGQQTQSAEGADVVEWTGTVADVQLIWTTTTNLRTGEKKQWVSMGIFQIRDKSGEERRVTADADDPKVRVLDAKGAPLAMSDVKKGARVKVRAVEKTNTGGKDYWVAREIVIQADEPEKTPSKKPSAR